MVTTVEQTTGPAAAPDEDLVERLARPTDDEVAAMDAWWRANNYLTVGQIYLHGEPAAARAAGARPHQAAAARPLGHQPRPVVHLRPRLAADPADRPGDASTWPARATAARRWSRPATSRAPTREIYPEVTQDTDGLRQLFRQFSAPGGIPSHVSVTTPGSIHEGGELGLRAGARLRRRHGQPGPARARGRRRRRGRDRARSRARGRASRSSTRRATAPCCRSCTSTARRSPGRPCWAARTRRRSASLLEGHGYDVIEVEGDDLPGMHHRFAAALARAWASIRAIQAAARGGDWDGARPRWPMIVLRTPKGWTGPDDVDGVQVARHLARAPGAAVRGAGEPRPPAAAGGLAAVLPPGGAVRRDRRARSELVRRANPTGDAADERHPARQRRPAHPRPRPAGLPRLRGRRADAGGPARRVDPQARRDDARHLPHATPTGSGCSAPTRPTATGSAPCSRSPTAASRSGSTPDDVAICRGTAG